MPLKLRVTVVLGALLISCGNPSFGQELKSVPEYMEMLSADDKFDRREASYRLSQLAIIASEAVPALIKALDDDDDQVWFNSVTALARMGANAEAAIPKLIDELEDAGGRRYRNQSRYRVSFALGKIGTKALPALGEALEHNQEGVRIGAAKALTWMGPDAVELLPKLQANMGSGDEELRETVAEALGSMGSLAEPAILEALNGESPEARQTASLAIRYLESPSDNLSDKLVEALSEETNAPVEASFIATLSKLNVASEIFVSHLMGAIDSDDDPVRQASINALILMPSPESRVVPALMEKLENGDSESVRTAAVILGQIGPGAEAAVPALIATRNDAESESEEAAAMEAALVYLSDAAVPELIRAMNDGAGWAGDCLREIGIVALPRLIARLDSDDPEAVQNVIALLSQLGEKAKEAIPQLLQLAREGSPGVQAGALSALAALQAPFDQLFPLAQSGLEHDSPKVRAQAARVVGTMGERGMPLLNALIAALSDENNEVVRNAAIAIGRLEPEGGQAVNRILELLSSPSLSLQLAAIEALGSLSGSDAGLDELRKLSAGDNPQLRVAALNALSEQGDAASAALPEIKQALKDSDEKIRLAALNAFIAAERNRNDEVPVLAGMLDDASREVRGAVLRRLGDIGERARPASERVFALLNSSEDQVDALGAIRGMEPESIPLLMEASRHSEWSVRIIMVERLGDVARPDNQEVLDRLEEISDNDDHNGVQRVARRAIREIRRKDS